MMTSYQITPLDPGGGNGEAPTRGLAPPGLEGAQAARRLGAADDLVPGQRYKGIAAAVLPAPVLYKQA